MPGIVVVDDSVVTEIFMDTPHQRLADASRYGVITPFKRQGILMIFLAR